MSDLAVPIYEAKNRLPFFIHKAETEGPVFISRRNEVVAVIQSKEDYDSSKQEYQSDFMKSVMKLREKYKDVLSDDFSEMLEKVRHDFNNRPTRASGEFKW